MPQICYQSAVWQRNQLLKRAISAVELLQAYEQRINQYNPAINALVTLDWEQAYSMAKQADEYLHKHGEPLGILHGLPLAVKDTFHVAGMRTTYGNLHFKDQISTYDDLLVQREKAAGAVIVGKSNTPDCASGGITTNEIFGLTRNPWNPQKTTSGSGGGGAAAIAAGLVSMADGSDVGGSARTPAGWANCVGFRPSSGRIPDHPGKGADGSISTAGVFTRSVADALLFMQAVDGPNLHSAVAYPAGTPGFMNADLEKRPAGKIAWVTEFAGNCFPGDIQGLQAEAKQVLLDAGFVVEDVDLGLGDAFRQLYANVNACAVARGLPKEVLTACLNGEPTKAAIKATLDRYLAMTPLQIQAIWQDVARLKVCIQLMMDEYPLLVFPTHADYAFDVDDFDMEQNFDWATLYLAPMLGLPALSVPAGFTVDGMPFGLMFHGRAGQDVEVMQVVHAFERETEYHQQVPDLSWLESANKSGHS